MKTRVAVDSPAIGIQMPSEGLGIVKQRSGGGQELLNLQEVVSRIEGYVKEQKENNRALNIVNLAGMFGLSVQEFREGKGFLKDKYIRLAVKKAFLLCESDLNQRMLEGKPPIGLIFHAKNHYGYQDKQDISHEIGISVKRVSYYDEERALKGRKGLRRRAEAKLSDTAPE